MKRKIVLTIISILCAGFSGYALMVNNVMDHLPPGDKKSESSKNLAFGAEHFLKGHAYALLAFSVYEHTPFHSNAFKSYLKKAKNEMEFSIKYYTIVYNSISENSSLSEMQTRFKSFDYESFGDRFSNKAVVKELIELFRTGNIAGIHKKTIDNAENILSTIATISKQEKPDIPTMWTLFEQLNNAEQFGNYATQIAHTINKDLRRSK